MAKEVQGRVTTTIGEVGSTPAQTLLLSTTSGEITNEVVGKRVIAASTNEESLSMGGITTAKFIQLSFYDNATDAPKAAIVKFNALAIVLPLAQHVLYVNDAGGITSINITTSAGNSTRVEYVIGG